MFFSFIFCFVLFYFVLFCFHLQNDDFDVEGAESCMSPKKNNWRAELLLLFQDH